MSKVRSQGRGFGLVFFRIVDGDVRFERQRMLLENARGKVSLRGVIRIGARPADDDHRVAVLLPFPAPEDLIRELERKFNTPALRSGAQVLGVEKLSSAAYNRAVA